MDSPDLPWKSTFKGPCLSLYQQQQQQQHQLSKVDGDQV